MESLIGLIAQGKSGIVVVAEELKREILRKSLHLLIALVPAIASWSVGFALASLSAGILFYSWCEAMRLRGSPVGIIGRVTEMAARRRDSGRFVLGPVTLALGAMLALVVYPDPSAQIAIYALAFGDGLSSLVGKLFGSIRIPFTGGKSVEGSLACFVAVLIPSYQLTYDLAGSLLVAFAATVVEALPTKDLDNILLPVATGLVATLVF